MVVSIRVFYKVFIDCYHCAMPDILKCPRHNLLEEIVCIGEYCSKRIGCELCIGKHDHKFYLDNKAK